MTAMNAVLKTDRVVILTDGASYDREGVLHEVSSKCVEVPGLRVALAVSGAILVRKDMLARLPTRFKDIDDIARNGESFFHAYYAERCEMLEEAGNPGMSIVIAGWSPMADMPVLVSFYHYGAESWFAVCPNSVWGPKTAGLPPIDPVTFDPRTDGLRLVQAQRWDTEAGFIVGGHIQLTEVTRSGISHEILHRWPEDRVGEKIDPAQSAGVVVPMDRRSRQERRRQEKLQRRAVA